MEKLIKIQSELKVPKGNFNSFGKYKYRSCEDILEAVKPLLTKYECTLLLTDDIVQVGNKIYLKAIAKLSDGKLEASVTGFAETGEHKGMSSEQCTGTASSYARKYALNGLFLIDETEADADHDNKQAPKEQPTPQQPSTPTAKPSLSNERFDAAFKAVEDGKLTKQDLAVKMSEFQLTGTQKINLKNFIDGQ